MVVRPSAWIAVGAACGWVLVLAAAAPNAQRVSVSSQAGAHDTPAFQTSENCMACHNGLTTPAGEDVSIGIAWRASMMANSSRDPYWQAAVRREVMDHPSAQAEIEDECAICHMPMARTSARASGRRGEIFRLLPTTRGDTREHRLAADGVACSLCHQIGPDKLGTRESFAGGYVIAAGAPRMQGPFDVDAGRSRVMRSAAAVEPARGEHVAQSEICATCHTLFTRAIGNDGTNLGSLPEQVPYLEWSHSAFRDERSCQSCHMPTVASTPIASVLGEPRDALARHTFIGGNFFMLGLLNRFRTELGVQALPHELTAAVHATIARLREETALVSVTETVRTGGTLAFSVVIRNLTGHKLPTGYPSRRAWLHITVRDAAGHALFESGAVDEHGMIAGNDNDSDPQRVEPHYDEITRPDEVQIYESTMIDANKRITTGLLQALSYVKDNRLLPRGFDKRTASPDVAVVGHALTDETFTGEGDRIRYRLDVPQVEGPLTVSVALRFQPISFRWAQNLRGYDAAEPRRFVSYWDSTAASSSTTLAEAVATVR